MELQKYLREKGLDSLKTEFNIKENRHQEFNNLVCLKYSQLESPLEKLIVQQCRGIILDEANDWAVVSYPYDKFFNYGESCAANINWQESVVYEKLDGSLMTLYFYQGSWRVQSSGTADASGQVNTAKYSFQQLFWQVWHHLGYELPQETEYCFMFELMTPYNRIVVRQTESKLVLHGVRNIPTLQEENPFDWQHKYNWQIVQTYPFNNLSAIINTTEKLDPLQGEGFIVCDLDFKRIKIKSSEYVRLSHLRSAITTRKILEVIIKNEGSEFLSYFPEYLPLYQELESRYDSLVTEIITTYKQYEGIETQKEFALAVKHFPYSGTLFAIRGGKASSARESLKNTSIQKIESLLKIDVLDVII